MYIQAIPANLHTVIEGRVQSVEPFKDLLTGAPMVELYFFKCTPKLANSGQCFDDNPKTLSIESDYHYNQKRKNLKLM